MKYFVWQQDWDRSLDVKDIKVPKGLSRSQVLMGKPLDDDVSNLHVILAKRMSCLMRL